MVRFIIDIILHYFFYKRPLPHSPRPATTYVAGLPTVEVVGDSAYGWKEAVAATFKRRDKDVECIFNVWARRGSPEQFAYILATAWHESWLTPIRERRANPVTQRTLYNLQNRYWLSGYYGRGYVQITWWDNYRLFSQKLNIPLLEKPDLALDRQTAAEILVEGMWEGLFTGVSIQRYINKGQKDFYQARRVVNILDQASLISNYAQQLLANYNSSK